MINGNVISDDNGSGVDTDIDGDAITVTEVNGQTTNLDAVVNGTNGGTFTIEADGTFSFETGSDFDSLGAGLTQTTTVDYTISDGEGGTDTATVTIVVSGTNEAPTAVGTIPPQVGVDSTAAAPLDISGFFDDSDAGDVLTFDAGSTLPPGLTIDPNTGVCLLYTSPSPRDRG